MTDSDVAMLLHDFDGLVERVSFNTKKRRLILKNLKNCQITIIWCKDFNGHLNCPNRERYLGPCRESVAKLFAKIVNYFYPLIFWQKVT